MTLQLRLFTGLLAVLWMCGSLAQAATITVTVSPDNRCSGGTVTATILVDQVGYDSHKIKSIELRPTSGASVLTNYNLLSSAGSTSKVSIPLPNLNTQTQYQVIATVDVTYSSNSFVGLKTETVKNTSSNLLTVNPIPPAPTATSLTRCLNEPSVTLTASGQALRWYTNQNPTQGEGYYTSGPVVATSAAGSIAYYVSQTINGCESKRTEQKVTINPKPDKPTVTSPYTFCQGTSPKALQADGQNIKWYDANGNQLSGAPTPSTQSTGNITYYVSQTVNECESDKRLITITVLPQPSAPIVSSPVTFCQGTAVTGPLSATPVNDLIWYDSNKQKLPGAPTPSTINATTTTYSVSRTVDGCESTKSDILVVVNPKPEPPATTLAVAVCQNTDPVSLTATGQNIKWYASNGNRLTDPPTTASAATYFVTQTNSFGCEGYRATVQVTITPLPPAPVATARTKPECQSITAEALTASGINLKWYDTRTGTTPLPSLIPQTSVTGIRKYYVSQTVDGCEGPRDSVTVTVLSRPAMPTVMIPAAVCQASQSISLSATALSGNRLNWYGTNETGGTPSPDPTKITTDAATTLFYYVSQIDNNGCESDRASIPVTVNPKPAQPGTTPIAFCANQVVPLTAIGDNGSTLKWYKTTTDTTFSLTAPTPSTAIIGTPVNYYVSQTNSFSCESDRAAIAVTIKSLPVAPSVAPNPVILCQSGPASPLTATGTGTLKWYDPAGQSSDSVTPSTNTVGPTVYKVTQTVNGCEGPPSSLTVVVIPKPLPPTVVVPTAVCQTTASFSLSATAASGDVLNWYGTAATGGTRSGTAPIVETQQAGSFTYYVSQTDANTCESDRAPIAVTIKPKPAAPATTPITFCANQVVPLTAIGDNGSTLNWYDKNETGGTPSPTAPTPSTAIIGTPVNYYVSQTVNGCESDRAAVAVTIKSVPAFPAVSSTPVIYCQGVQSTPLSATAVTGGALNWYTTQNGGTRQDELTPFTDVVNTRYYYVSQTVDGCESQRATIAVTTIARPALPGVTAQVAYCLGQTASPLQANGQNLKWYDRNNALLPNAPTPLTTAVGKTTYFVTQTNATGCESDSATITVTVNPIPDAPGVTPASYCQNFTGPTSLTATGQNLKWYDSTGKPLSAAPAPPTNQVAVYTYLVTQTVTGCESATATVTATIKPLPARPTVAATPIAYCLGATNAVPLSATATDASGSLRWYDANGNGLSGPPTPSTAAAGTFSYSVSQVVNACESPTATVSFIIKPISAPPTVTATVSYCQSTTGLTALTATGQNLKWYDANNNALAAAPIPSTTTPGTVTYFVTQTTANSCESNLARIDVQITAAPDAPVAANVTYCQGVKATPLIATGTGTLKWYDANNNPLAGAPTPLTTANSSYYVTQIVNGCESKPTLVTVTVNALPAPPTPVAASVSLCQNTAASPLTTSVPNAKWYDGTYNPLAGAPTPLTSQPGTITYYVTQTDANNCESSKAPITVTIRALPAAPVPAAARFCQNTTAQQLTATGTGTLKWYDASNNPLAGAPTPLTTSAGVINYYVSQTDANGCESNKAIVNVTVNPKPIAVASQTISYCQSAVPSSLTVVGQSLKWYQTATGGSAIAQPNPPTASTTYYVSQTDATTGCESDRTAITVTVGAKPTAPVTQAITYCENALPASLPVVGQNLKWYTTLTGTSATTTPAPPTITTTYYVTQTDAVTGCESDRVAVPVTVKAKPRLPITTPTTYCLGATASLTATATDGGQLNWYGTSQVGGTASSSPPTVSINTVVTTLFYVSQTVNGCESDRAIIAVTGSSKQVQPTTAPITLCQGSTAQPLSATATSGGVLNWYGTAATGGTASPNAPAPATGNLSTIPYYVSQTLNGCESDRVAIFVTVSAKPTAPAVVSSVTVCQGTTAPLSATTSVGGILNWYTQPTGGPASQLAPTPSPAIDRYYVSQTVNGCESERAAIAVAINPKATATLLSGDKTIYSSQSTVLSFSLTGTGPWTIGYSDSLITTGTTSFSTAIANTNSFTVSVAPTGTTIYKAVSVSDKGCGIGTPSGTARITVSPLLGEPDPLVSEVKVYPVPTDGTVTVDIDLPLQKDPAELQLINYTGTVINQLTTKQHQTTLHLEDHPSGPYLLYIKVGDRSTVRKIMKN